MQLTSVASVSVCSSASHSSLVLVCPKAQWKRLSNEGKAFVSRDLQKYDQNDMLCIKGRERVLLSLRANGEMRLLLSHIGNLYLSPVESMLSHGLLVTLLCIAAWSFDKWRYFSFLIQTLTWTLSGSFYVSTKKKVISFQMCVLFCCFTAFELKHFNGAFDAAAIWLYTYVFIINS